MQAWTVITNEPFWYLLGLWDFRIRPVTSPASSAAEYATESPLWRADHHINHGRVINSACCVCAAHFKYLYRSVSFCEEIHLEFCMKLEELWILYVLSYLKMSKLSLF